MARIINAQILDAAILILTKKLLIFIIAPNTLENVHLRVLTQDATCPSLHWAIRTSMNETSTQGGKFTIFKG